MRRLSIGCVRILVARPDLSHPTRLGSLFADALAPGGVLLLGKVETLFGPARERLVLEEPRERIYRRAGA